MYSNLNVGRADDDNRKPCRMSTTCGPRTTGKLSKEAMWFEIRNDETLSEILKIAEDETLPEIHEIADSGFERVANFLLTLCQQNETEKHGKSSEIQRQIETEARRAIRYIVEEIYRDWKSLAHTGNGGHLCERNPGRKL